MGRKPARSRFGSMFSQSLAPAGSSGHLLAKVSRATPRRTPQICARGREFFSGFFWRGGERGGERRKGEER